MNHPAHDKSNDQRDIADIKASAPPSEESDPQTRGEERALEKAREIAEFTPTKQVILLRERTIERLEKENKRLVEACDELQKRLDDLHPRYIAIKQAKRSVTPANVLTTIALQWAGR